VPLLRYRVRVGQERDVHVRVSERPADRHHVHPGVVNECRRSWNRGAPDIGAGPHRLMAYFLACHARTSAFEEPTAPSAS